jgi:hypothetical protein
MKTMTEKNSICTIDGPGITGNLAAMEAHAAAGGSFIHEVGADGFLVSPEKMRPGQGLEGKQVRLDGTVDGVPLSLYEVSDGMESDWVAAYTPEQAVALAESSGCHCDRDEGCAPLTVVLMPKENAKQRPVRDDDTGEKLTLWDWFQRTSSPDIVASTIW